MQTGIGHFHNEISLRADFTIVEEFKGERKR